MDPYSTLGVTKNASIIEVKQAYRRLVKQWHPDLNPSPNAKYEFDKVQQAYDRITKAQPAMATARPQTSPQPNPPQPTRPQRAHAERLRKRSEAAAKLRKAKAEAATTFFFTREKFDESIRNCHEFAETAAEQAKFDSIANAKAARQEAENRLITARQDYERLIQSIGRERDEKLRFIVAERDRKIAEVINTRDMSVRFNRQGRAANEVRYREEIEKIEREFQADIAAAT